MKALRDSRRVQAEPLSDARDRLTAFVEVDRFVELLKRPSPGVGSPSDLPTSKVAQDGAAVDAELGREIEDRGTGVERIHEIVDLCLVQASETPRGAV